MALLDKLKSLFGMGDSSSDDSRRDPGVTVERDTRADATDANTDTEDAVKGTDSDPSTGTETETGAAGSGGTDAAGVGADASGDPDTTSAGEGESAASDTDAAGSTGSVVDETAEDEADIAAEPGEAVQPGTAAGEEEEAGDAVDAGGNDPTVDDAAAADEGADAGASTGSMVDEQAENAGAAEPAEAAGPESEEMDTDVGAVDAEDVDPGADATDDIDVDDGATPDDTSSDGGGATSDDDAGGSAESVKNVKGIGPAYADRLREIGVETVADLANADAADVADRITVSEKRVQRWIDRAADYDA